jgi:hypothetical protein
MEKHEHLFFKNIYKNHFYIKIENLISDIIFLLLVLMVKLKLIGLIKDI